ncbi:MAG: FHA domain-containing protein [Chloroflexi bacterium]|nr:FHA domain-containing protein [Chloroflexota bacterium]
MQRTLAGGRAHVASPDGREPVDPAAWGWRQVEIGVGDNVRFEWRPKGSCIGWLDEGELYLEPDTAYTEVQRMARDGGGTSTGISLRGGAVILGRGADNDLDIDDKTVSRRHALVIETADGYVIKDLGSANGTVVNGTMIATMTTLSLTGTRTRWEEAARPRRRNCAATRYSWVRSSSSP